MGVTIFRPGQRLVIPAPGVQVWSPRAASAAASGILDGISNVAAAYSLRKLRSAYAGSAVRVRRSSDSTEQDIGFDGTGEFDSSAFSSFVGGGTGYVKTWYDQSGNGRNATQATTGNQPSIVLSAINTKPSLFLNSATSLSISTFSVTALGLLIAMSYQTSDAYMSLLSKSSGSTAAPFDIRRRISGGIEFTGGSVSTTTTLTNNGVYVLGANHTGTAGTLWLTGTDKTSLTGGWGSDTGTMHIGRRDDSGTSWRGYIAEIIILSVTIPTTDHNTIGANMATRFGLSWTTVT